MTARLTLLFLLALALAGCGAGLEPVAGPTPPAAVIAPADRLLAAATAEQRPALRDGRVSAAEYAAATRASRACLRRAGLPLRLDAIRPVPGGDLEFGWQVRAGSPKALARRERQALAAFDRCERRFRTVIAVVHHNQRVVPPEARPARMARLATCLRRAGAKLPEQPDLRALVEASRRGARRTRCLDAEADLLRAPAPLP